MTHGGIRIETAEDTLLWMYDKQMGMVTAKKTYDLIASKHRTIMANDFFLKIRHLNIPQKLKCFIWLTCNILTLGILYARNVGTVPIGVVYAKGMLKLWNTFL